MKRDYHIIGACSCWGAQIRACEKGPLDLAEGKVFERLIAQGASIRKIEMVHPSAKASETNIPLAKALPVVHDFNVKLMHRVQSAIREGSFPVVIGGDHTNGVGTWNGMEPPFGLLWIDAHMDAHTPETSPSGAYHGMPIAALLGHGLPELAKLRSEKPVLKPQNLAIIGVRSFEEGEEALLKSLNVRVYFMDEVKSRGLKAILPEAVEHVANGVSRYGVSVDVDAFSLDDAPGVGSPEPGGMPFQEFLPFVSRFSADPRLIGFEIVEFNPDRDVQHKTRELIYHLLKELIL